MPCCAWSCWPEVRIRRGRPGKRAVLHTATERAGAYAYLANCVACHGPHLSDGPLGKPLKGPEFMRSTAATASGSLRHRCGPRCRAASPGRCDPATYAALVAYLLQENAIVAGQGAAAVRPAGAGRHDGSRRRVQHHGLLALHAEEGSRATQSPGSLHAGRQGRSRQSAAAGLADLAARMGRARFQSPGANHSRQRLLAAHGVELDTAGGLGGSGSPGSRRHDVRAELR